MAQATADLPDPDHLAAAPPDSLDELLSQLVTRDIERMLAEDTTVSPAVQAPDLASELNQFFSELQKTHLTVEVQPAALPQREHYRPHTPWYLLPLLWIFQLARISR